MFTSVYYKIMNTMIQYLYLAIKKTVSSAINNHQLYIWFSNFINIIILLAILAIFFYIYYVLNSLKVELAKKAVGRDRLNPRLYLPYF